MTTNIKRKIATIEMRMLRGIIGVTTQEYIRNEEIGGLPNLLPIDEIMHSGRLRWFGHLQRREENNVACRGMNVSLTKGQKTGTSNEDVETTAQRGHEGGRRKESLWIWP